MNDQIESPVFNHHNSYFVLNFIVFIFSTPLLFIEMSTQLNCELETNTTLSQVGQGRFLLVIFFCVFLYIFFCSENENGSGRSGRSKFKILYFCIKANFKLVNYTADHEFCKFRFSEIIFFQNWSYWVKFDLFEFNSHWFS